MTKILVICSQCVNKKFSEFISDNRVVFQLNLALDDDTIDFSSVAADSYRPQLWKGGLKQNPLDI